MAIIEAYFSASPNRIEAIPSMILGAFVGLIIVVCLVQAACIILRDPAGPPRDRAHQRRR